MGEVGVNAGENPTLKINGDMNGSCDEDHDEAMEVDPLDESPKNLIIKNDSSDSKDAIKTTEDDKLKLMEETSLLNPIKKKKNEGSARNKERQEEDDDEEDDDDVQDKTNERNKRIQRNGDKIPIVLDEVHDIPDSDEEKEKELEKELERFKSQQLIAMKCDALKLQKNQSMQRMDIDSGTSNGHLLMEDDRPVSIHSDSDLDDDNEISQPINKMLKIDVEKKTEIALTTVQKKNGDCKSPEVQEILSDKEDCIVVEDSKNDKSLISPRRSTRQRKSVVKVRDFSAFDDDIEEIIEDPLQTSQLQKKINNKQGLPAATVAFLNHNHISIKDARSLSIPSSTTITPKHPNQYQQQFIQNNKKESTLVIIDTNSILAGRGGQPVSVQNMNKQNQNSFSVMPVGVPAQGIYPPNMRTSITPIHTPKPMIPIQQQPPPPPPPPQLLPALTDDMFVLEAPSFIVPYIYEKPPSENLKEIVIKIGNDLEELKKKEELLKDKVKLEQKDKKMDDSSQDSTISKETNDSSATLNKDLEKIEKKKKKSDKDGDDSWDESDTSTDDEASDSEQRTKILIKESKEDLDDIKKHIITPDSGVKDSVNTAIPSLLPGGVVLPIDPNKKSENYFESPLGKFFMTIGINLVQEHVQTDLLRQQKKKRDREGQAAAPSIQMAINSLVKNLELSREKNEPFKFDMKRCEYCNFKSESALAMAHHYETPHMRNYIYKCNFCSFETRPPSDILYHMEAVHNIKGRLEKAPAYHQCPNCPFEDNGKSKLVRHTLVCGKKFRPDLNLAPPIDWEPPAKIPRIKPKHGLVGTATAYQAMAAQQRATANILPRPTAAQTAALMRGRGRPQTVTKVTPGGATVLRAGQNTLRAQLPPGMILPSNYQLAAAAASGQFIQMAGSNMAMMPNSHSSLTIQTTSGAKTTKAVQQPSISITPLPRQIGGSPQNSQLNLSKSGSTSSSSNSMKPGQSASSSGGGGGGNKTTFVVCEICDSYIKDLDQLRNHMQWIHKVKIHPKMIYNRPPLNCQKCQFRFFTDQGLERHLLGSHGLVTSSMQEAANKGKDAGRCPVCGRVYQWKLLNHVSRDHNMTLKPAHLSYKCTVCTATFGMYKQFENHVYSAHSTVAKKAMDGGSKRSTPSSSSSNLSSNNNQKLSGGDSLLKPLKINDEITIIPQPATKNIKTIELESHVID